MNKLSILLISGLLLLVSMSCSGVKHLQAGELLYTKTTINLIDSSQTLPLKRTRNELLALTRPIPNTGLFKWPLGIYNLMGKPKKTKGLRSWIKNKLGEPPALYEPQQIVRTKAVLEKYLRDKGLFQLDIKEDTSINGKKVALTYTIRTSGRYRIRAITWPADSMAISRLLQTAASESFLQAEAFYDLEQLNLERERLAALAADQGFADFNTAYVYYLVDTTVGPLRADLHVRIKPREGSLPQAPYYIGQTYLYPEYDINTASGKPFADTVELANGLHILQNDQLLFPSLLDRLILQRQGDRFSRKDQRLSQSHLLELGVFKFANLKYINRQENGKNILDRYFYLTPNRQQEITAEFELNNRTGNYLGTAATFTYSHKNIFGAAERLDIELAGGLETQLGSGLQLINSADINFEMNLSAPRFMAPIQLNRPNVKFIPRTEINFGVNYQRRIQFYSINAVSLKMGYNWREDSKRRHQFYPIQMNRVSLSNRTPAFEALLKEDPRLQQSFDDIFIAGLNYTYLFSNAAVGSPDRYSYFKGELETSGNVLNIFSLLIKQNETRPYAILGLPYAQFVKLNLDYRYYYPYRKNLTVTRLYFGVGVPFGNSDVLPYTKQFFIGGSNSIRAFRLQGLGPGTYVADIADDDAIRNQFIDQTGDIKLEGNVEYRFPLFSYLKGALFLDAGNVWLLRAGNRPEGVFKFGRFLNEIALGTGLGFRLDFQFFVIRLDGAFALRKPFLNQGFQWTFSDIAPFSRSWRKNNLIWNLGIGYPF
ncbi:MAG: BamA/TamA family outer membrane protein [Saprospiraceae bacterium]